MQPNRRLILKAGLGSLFAAKPWAEVWAQSDGALKLMRAPKVALVIGNSKYKDSPLKNPANDARAMGESLAAAGFAVTTRLDATRPEMAAAVDAYLKELAAKKCVGLFYYAGHGVQLQWKNYMLPVDAEIDTVDDVATKAVEVNVLMEGLARAANPLNVIILDACRDNPFGTAKPAQAKGLSQMDAPNNTILAYATSPGNVASDGEGANGLYTENFLKEMKVPEAKLEDVFKRVRLGVRRSSKGAQVPWESTSLEEDYWFFPPKELKKLSEAENERAYREEQDVWEKARIATVPGPLEDYLRRFPSGRFSELAQFRLEQALAKQGEKKLEIAKQEGNPYTKGSVSANIGYKVGDSYSYRVLDYFSKAETGRLVQTVTRITDDEVIFDSGLITDLLGNNLKLHTGTRFSPNQTLPFEYAIGKRWPTRFEIFAPNGAKGQAEGEVRIAGRETITVPAGTFDAFKIEIRTHGVGFGLPPFSADVNYWMAPDKLRLQVVRESVNRRQGRAFVAERYELVSFKQG